MRIENDELKAIDTFVGQRLRSRLLHLGITLMSVAEKIGISYQQMQKYELGQTRLSAPILYQLSNFYSVKPQYFFEGFETYMRRQSGEQEYASHERLSIMVLSNNPAEERRLRQIINNASEPVDLFFVHKDMQAMSILRQKDTNVDFLRPDLVFVDWDDSKKDGLFLLRDIKRDRDIMDIPVVLFASVVSQSILKLVYSYQAAGYVSKNSDNYEQHVLQIIGYWASSVLLPFLQHDEVAMQEDWPLLKTAA